MVLLVIHYINFIIEYYRLNSNQNLTFNLPIYENAFPILSNNRFVIIAWRLVY